MTYEDRNFAQTAKRMFPALMMTHIRPNGTSRITTVPANLIKELGLVNGDTLLWSFDKEARTFTCKVATLDDIHEAMGR